MKRIIILSCALVAVMLVSACNETIFATARGIRTKATQAIVWDDARKGDKEAQYNLGALHCCSQRPVKDTATALKWWCRAAAQGQKDAMFEIAKLYGDRYKLTGSNVPIDPVLAATYFTLAQKNHHTLAGAELAKTTPSLSSTDLNQVETYVRQFPHIPCELGR